MTVYIASLAAAAVLFTAAIFAFVAGGLVAVVYVICELTGIKGRRDK